MKFNAALRTLAASALAAALGGTGIAHAEQGYIGFGFGSGSSSDWCNIDYGACEDSDTGFKFFGGARLSDSLAAEISYTDFGTVTDFSDPDHVDISGLTLSLVGMLALSEQFDLLGKLGIGSWTADAGSWGSDTGSDVAFGVGVQLETSENLAIRGEWEQIQAGHRILGDYTLLSVSILYRF
ncbi:MAG: outer membrane beta-barrel protein [Pseudomonadota bacterium]